MENYEESNSIPEDKFYFVKNARFSGKVVSSKKGYLSVGNALVGGTKAQGIYQLPYWNTSTLTNYLYEFYNKSFYRFNEATQIWDIVSTTWPNVDDVFTDGQVYNNNLYVVNPLMATNGTVTSITILSGGGPYGSIPTVTLTGGGGTGATAVATLDSGTIKSVTLTGSGTGYVTPPIVIVTDGTGIGANITANVLAGSVISFNVNNGGSGYVAPIINLSGGGGTGAGGSAILGSSTVTAITVTNAGMGYTSAPIVTITGGGGSTIPAIAVANISNSGNGIGKISTNSTFSVVPNSPRGTMMQFWVERMFIAGDKLAPNAWIASKPALATNPLNVEVFDTTNGAITDLLGVDGTITAMRVLNNDLYMFKQDSIYFNTKDNFASGQTQFSALSRTGGATNQKSTIVVENDIWFYDQKNNAIRSLGTERNLGTDPRTKALTEIIKRSMDLLDPIQDNPVMIYNKRIIKLSLKTKGSPTNNFRIVFDYNTGGFSIELGESVNVNTVYNGDVYYGEDSTGQTFKDDTGYTANGAAYPFQADTPFMDDERPDIFKRCRYIYFRGKQSYDQDIEIRLYRDGNYNIYSSYPIPSPRSRGIAQTNNVNDGAWGSAEQGSAAWGGSGEMTQDIPLYELEELIGVSRISNLFAIGIFATINGGKVVVEQLIPKVIDENENYKRTNL